MLGMFHFQHQMNWINWTLPNKPKQWVNIMAYTLYHCIPNCNWCKTYTSQHHMYSTGMSPPGCICDATLLMSWWLNHHQHQWIPGSLIFHGGLQTQWKSTVTSIMVMPRHGPTLCIAGPLCIESTREFSAHGPVMQRSDGFFVLNLNMLLNKQCNGWWNEIP